MSEEDEDEAPAVTLGAAVEVEGAPLARVVSRLHWGMSKGEIRDREGSTVIRTPDGPRELGAVLDDVATPYFESRREFVEAVRQETGVGPVPTDSVTDEDTEDETTEE